MSPCVMKIVIGAREIAARQAVYEQIKNTGRAGPFSHQLAQEPLIVIVDTAAEGDERDLKTK